MNNGSEKFSNLSLSEKIIVILSITFLIIFSLSLLLALFFFGFTGLFQLLGVQYDSVSALILFLVNYVIISIIGEFFSKIISLIIVSYLKSNSGKILIPFILDTFANWIILHFIDEAMNSITIPTWVEIITVLLLACADFAFDDRKKKNKLLNSLRKD